MLQQGGLQISLLECLGCNPLLCRQRGKKRRLTNPDPVPIVGLLDPVQHDQPIAPQRRDGQNRTDRRLGVQQSPLPQQQFVKVALAKMLAGQRLDPLIMGAHIITQCLAHRLTATTQPETARMQLDLEPSNGGCRLQQGGGTVAPATERVIDIMEGGLLFAHLHSHFNLG